MLGLSLQKLLVLAAILGAVWWGFKWLSRLEQVRAAKERVRPGKAAKAPKVEELVECPRCRTFIAAGSLCDCGRKS